MVDFPFFMKYPGNDKCTQYINRGKPNKQGIQRRNDEPCNPNGINNCDYGDEPIFYSLHCCKSNRFSDESKYRFLGL